MARHEEARNWSRREVLATGCAVAGSLGLGRGLLGGVARADDDDAAYSPFKMGIQSYSLRGYKQDGHPSLRKALEVTKGLGLHYWEAFLAHAPMSINENGKAMLKDQLAAAGVTLAGYGVVH